MSEIVYVTDYKKIQFIKRHRKQWPILADIYKRNWLVGIYVSMPENEAAKFLEVS